MGPASRDLRLPSIDGLRAFEAAARLGTFERAAEELAITASAVSKGVATLEELLGTGLPVRTGKSLALTAAGKEYLAQVRAALGLLAAMPPAASPSNASPYTMWQSVAPYNEYWMWMGDAWRVVANRYSAYSGVAFIALSANVVTSITSLTAPRAGSIYVRGILSAVNNQNTLTLMQAYIQRTRSGVTSTVLDTLSVYATSVVTQYSQARPLARTDALAGDVYTLIANANLAMDLSPTNQSSIHLEYLQ